MGWKAELGQPAEDSPWLPWSWSTFPVTASSSYMGDGNKVTPRFLKIILFWFIVFLITAGIGIFCYQHGRSFPLSRDLIDKAVLLYTR